MTAPCPTCRHEVQHLHKLAELIARFGRAAQAHPRRVNAGFPDWVLAHPGHERVIYAELKTEIGRVSPEQRRWLDVLTASGHEVHVWRPRDLLRGDIRDVLRGARP